MGIVIEFPREEAERRHKAKLTPAGWQYFKRPPSVTWLQGFDSPLYGSGVAETERPCDTEDKNNS